MVTLAAIGGSNVKAVLTCWPHVARIFPPRHEEPMALRSQSAPVTADDLEHFPDDGNRYEVIDGELFVTPAPLVSHQRVQMRLVEILLPYVRACGLELFVAPTAVRASPLTEVQPDLLAVMRGTSVSVGDRYIAMRDVLLAVEIASRSTARVDRERKRPLYMAEGVREYWIVDGDAGTVEVWRAGAAAPEIARDALRWQPVVTREALLVHLSALWDVAAR